MSEPLCDWQELDPTQPATKMPSPMTPRALQDPTFDARQQRCHTLIAKSAVASCTHPLSHWRVTLATTCDMLVDRSLDMSPQCATNTAAWRAPALRMLRQSMQLRCQMARREPTVELLHRQQLEAARCASRATSAHVMSADARWQRVVLDSVAEVEGLCARDASLRNECTWPPVQRRRAEAYAGCPFSARSEVALKRIPSVEACIRMGYWWNRPYCAHSMMRNPPAGVHLVNATSGEPIHLPIFDAKRIATFTSRVWPFAISAASRLAVAIEPSDSTPPGQQPCVPTLLAARVTESAYNGSYSRHAPDGILWPGVTIGLQSLRLHSLAFYQDIPWSLKRNMLVYRGSVNMCWALEGACKSRDLPLDDGVQSHASRLVAWRRLHRSSLADVDFVVSPSTFDLSSKQRKTYPWDPNPWFKGRPGSVNPWLRMATESIERFFPQRTGNLSIELQRVFGELMRATQNLCRRPPSRVCAPGARKALLSPQEQSQYKIILALDGESYTGSFGWAQLTSSAVMAPRSAYETYQEIGMQPWVHYIPTKLDFSDAEENAKWCFAHSRKCEAIGAAGRAHMMRLFAEAPPTAPLPPSPPSPPPSRYSILPTSSRELQLSDFERRVDELIVAQLAVNARRC